MSILCSLRALLAPAGVVVAAGAAPAPAAAQAGPPTPAVPDGRSSAVTFSTDFGFNGRHAPYYTALEKDIFKEMGSDVRIVRGSGSLDAIRQVVAVNARFVR